MKTLFSILIAFVLICLVSSIWINHYARKDVENKRLKADNDYLIIDRAEALKRASDCQKEKQVWINQVLRKRK